ncbi:MAG: glycosyltransferase [Chitinophagaceae bacterium]|nr:MAG: glycosyltransferase [Chitinophagaceae bacterium]
MIRKGLLVFPIYTDLKRLDAIVIKNEGIAKAFVHNGVAVDVLRFRTSGIYCGDTEVFRFSANRYKRAWQLFAGAWPAIARFAVRNNYDFVWVRLLLVNPVVTRFFRIIRKDAPKLKVLIEYGAYPFEAELDKWRRRFYKLNKASERKVHSLSDLIVTYSGQTQLDGVPVVPIDNGVDLEGIGLVHPATDVQQCVRLISVSSLQKWHAVERLLEGMALYQQKASGTPVLLDIVGSGPFYEALQERARTLGLSDVVVFHGHCVGQRLDELYNRNHIAIGTLGFHRIGITNSSSLKNRDYFARGLPVVLSTPDKDMPATLPFVLYVPEGEEPVDMAPIVAFAQRAYNDPNINQQVRTYAEGRVSWNSKIKTVLSYLNK